MFQLPKNVGGLKIYTCNKNEDIHVSQNVYSPLNSSTYLVMYVGIHGLLGIAMQTHLPQVEAGRRVRYNMLASKKKQSCRSHCGQHGHGCKGFYGLSCFCVATCKKHTHTSTFKVQASSVSGFSLGLFLVFFTLHFGGSNMPLVSYFNSHLNCLILKVGWEVLFTHATVVWY